MKSQKFTVLYSINLHHVIRASLILNHEIFISISFEPSCKKCTVALKYLVVGNY